MKPKRKKTRRREATAVPPAAAAVLKVGDVRAAVRDAMERSGLTTYDVWKLTGQNGERLSRTVVYEFLAPDDADPPPRDSAISTVERIAGAVGLGIAVAVGRIPRPARTAPAAEGE